ncbi:hypothetical protein, partial [Trichothermofontia sp.]
GEGVPKAGHNRDRYKGAANAMLRGKRYVAILASGNFFSDAPSKKANGGQLGYSPWKITGAIPMR